MVAHWCQSNKIKIEQIKKIFRTKSEEKCIYKKKKKKVPWPMSAKSDT